MIENQTIQDKLTGSWIYSGEGTTEYTVSFNDGICNISGVDLSDGEIFVISEVLWDGRDLRFTSFMPSTNYDLHHIFRVISPTEIDHEWMRVERWIKKPAA